MGQTLERMKEGYSKIRNEALAHAFSYMNLIEHWGSGIPRIIDRVKAAGLREPEFIGGDVDLRINIYRGQVDVNNAKNDAKSSLNDAKNGENDAKSSLNDAKNGENDAKNSLNDAKNEENDAKSCLNDAKNKRNDAKKQKELWQEEKLLSIIKENPCEKQAYYAAQLGLSKRTISRLFVSLREKGVLVQRGTSRKAHWEIIK